MSLTVTGRNGILRPGAGFKQVDVEDLHVKNLVVGGDPLNGVVGSLSVNTATITVGAEAANVINVNIALDAPGVVDVFLSDSAAGLGLVATAPDGGTAIGTDGAIIGTLTATKAFRIQSEADGNIDIDITESGALDIYAVVVLPNGSQVVSGIVSFAA